MPQLTLHLGLVGTGKKLLGTFATVVHRGRVQYLRPFYLPVKIPIVTESQQISLKVGNLCPSL